MEDFNTKKLRAISFYTVLTAAAILSIYELLKNFSAIMEKLTIVHGVAMSIIMPIILGFVFAYLLNPLISWYEKHIEKHQQTSISKNARAFSVVAALMTAIIVVVVIGSLLVSSITKELQLGGMNGAAIIIAEFIENLDRLYEAVVEKLSSMNLQSPDFQSLVQDLSSKIYTILNDTVLNFSDLISTLSADIAKVIFGIVISIYLMLDQKDVNFLIRRVGTILFKESTRLKIEDNLRDLDRAFSGYLRGQLLDVLFMMFAISASLLLVGCKFAIGIGVLAGLGNLIPYVGPFVAYTLTTVVCLLHEDYSVLGISLFVLVIIQLIDGNIVGPRLLGRSISVHPLLIILFLIAGGAIGGLLGMLFAVPLGGFLTIRFKKWLKNHET